MSGRTWSWQQAVQESGLPPTTRFVLLNLSVYMNNKGGNCYPTTAQQATDTGLSERAVCTHLKLAEEAGFIIKKVHGFKGKQWKNHEYIPVHPEDIEPLNQGTEPRSVPSETEALNVTTEGTEPDDIKALNDVQSNFPDNLPITSQGNAGAKAHPIPAPQDDRYLDKAYYVTLTQRKRLGEKLDDDEDAYVRMYEQRRRSQAKLPPKEEKKPTKPAGITPITEEYHPNETFREMLKSLQQDVGAAQFNSWLRHMRFKAVHDGALIVTVSTRFIREWIEGHLKYDVRRAAQQAWPEVKSVDIQVQAS